MSIQNINISKDYVKGNCDLKCSYNFKYKESQLAAKNNGVMITLKHEGLKMPPVLYNNQKYNVVMFQIFAPSIHIFNGAKAVAEIVIEHYPVLGGNKLNVAIPIFSSTESNDATTYLTQIIQTVATNAPSEGETTNISLSGFTLQKVVPVKPFYSYTSPNGDEWIVYDITYAIPLSSSTLDTLTQIIQEFPIPTPGDSLFYNSKGPNQKKMGDGIYISCQPTGSSTEETSVEYTTNSTSYDFSNLLNSPVTKTIIQILIGCILFTLVFVTMNYFYSLITSNAGLKMPNLSKNLEVKS